MAEDLLWLESWLFESLDFLRLQNNHPYADEREYRCHPGVNVEVVAGAPATIFTETRLRFVPVGARRIKVRFPTRAARRLAHSFIEQWSHARIEKAS